MTKKRKAPSFILIDDLCTAWQIDRHTFMQNITQWTQPPSITETTHGPGLTQTFIREFVQAYEERRSWSKLVYPPIPANATKIANELPRYS